MIFTPMFKNDPAVNSSKPCKEKPNHFMQFINVYPNWSWPSSAKWFQ